MGWPHAPPALGGSRVFSGLLRVNILEMSLVQTAEVIPKEGPFVGDFESSSRRAIGAPASRSVSVSELELVEGVRPLYWGHIYYMSIRGSRW